jgi:hypothetical protein
VPERHVERGEGKPVLDRPGFVGSENVEVLACGIEHGLAHFRQTVGDAMRGARCDRVDVHGLDQAVGVLGIREPLRVRRPVVRDIRRIAIDLVGRDLLRPPRLHVEQEEVVGVVDAGDELLVRRPLQIAIEACATLDRHMPRQDAAVDRPHVQLVLAARIGDPGNLSALRRPGRCAVVRAGGLGEIARLTLARGHDHDLAAILERRALQVRRAGHVAHVLGIAHPARARLAQVRAGRDMEGHIAAAGSEDVQPPGLLVNDAAVAGAGVDDREVGVLSELLNLRARRIERIQVELAVAVRAEIELRADPHRVEVVAARGGLRHAHDRMVGQAHDRDARHAAAAIALPLRQRLEHAGRHHRVRDALIVGRHVGIAPERDRQALGERAPRIGGERIDDEQVRVAARVRIAPRAEDDASLRVEALDDVLGAVPREALRRAARDGHDVDIDVAVVVGAECDRGAVGREARMRLDAFGGRQPVARRAVTVGDPHVAVVDESDVRPADVRVGEQQGVLRVDREGGRNPGREDGGEGCQAGGP